MYIQSQNISLAERGSHILRLQVFLDNEIQYIETVVIRGFIERETRL